MKEKKEETLPIQVFNVCIKVTHLQRKKWPL